MKGKSDEEIMEERAKALSNIPIEKGSEVIESFFRGAPHDAKPLWFLAKSLELMSGADLVIFTKGWQEARGCRIEYACAKAYGLKVIECE